jgi:hypothetical protein
MAAVPEEEEWHWNVGDECQAPFSVDGLLYKAVIKKLLRKKSGHVIAQVEFVGYEEDGLETVLISDLVPVKKDRTRCSFLGATEDTNQAITLKSTSNRSESVVLSQLLREKYELLERESVMKETVSTRGHTIRNVDKGQREYNKGKKGKQPKQPNQSKELVVGSTDRYGEHTNFQSEISGYKQLFSPTT